MATICEWTILIILNRGQMDELIQEKVVQKENELNATYDEKMRNYEERQVTSRSSRPTVIYQDVPANKISSVRYPCREANFVTFVCRMSPTKLNS